MTSEGSTIADLTAMVQQLHLENRLLEYQLAERKIEVEELQDDLRLLRRGLSAKMKHLFEATGHKERRVIIISLVWAPVLVILFRFSSV